MPAPEGNKNAEKDSEDKHGDFFSLRGPTGLKGRANWGARARNMKLSPWLIEAIEEKCDRENVPTPKELEKLRQK